MTREQIVLREHVESLEKEVLLAQTTLEARELDLNCATSDLERLDYKIRIAERQEKMRISNYQENDTEHLKPW
tara:strand:+ start:463 stop:681 length:219 start_codon:yes stop_codon:yes gene_type:complete